MALTQPPAEPELATKQDIQRVDEKVQHLDQDVQLVRQDVKRVEQRVERVEQDVHAVRQDVQRVEQRVEQHAERVEEKVERIERRLRRLETGFGRLEEKIDAMLTHLASKADVEHMGRITTIWVVGAITALMGIVLTTMWNMTQAVVDLAR